MNFPDAVKMGFRNYIAVYGRSSRSEFWYWTLFTLLLGILTSIVDTLLMSSHLAQAFNNIVNLAVFVPSVSVAIRRLHDTGRSGWWYLIAFTIIGVIPLLIWFCKKGTPQSNKYGPNANALETHAERSYASKG